MDTINTKELYGRSFGSPLNHDIHPIQIESLALSKIDVQVYELEVLEGCRDFLENFLHLCWELFR